jgi:hypothetical protein
MTAYPGRIFNTSSKEGKMKIVISEIFIHLFKIVFLSK